MFEQVKQEIDNKIKTNGNNEITATRLNGVLQDMMDATAEELSGYVQKTDPPSPAAGDIVVFNEFGGLGTSEKTVNDFATASQGAKADTALQPTGVKTINNQSIVGSGNITIEGGGTDDYADLDNKPQINSVALSGNKSASDLGLATAAQGAKADTAVQPSALNDYVQKSQTTGLLKNDGTVDTQTADRAESALQPLSGAQENNFASFDSDGGIKDSGCNENSFATAAQGMKADTAVQPSVLNDYVQKSQTNGLLKNDGTVDTQTEGKAASALQPVSGAIPNNFASFDSNGGTKDSTYKAADFVQNITRGGSILQKTDGVVDIPEEIENVAAKPVAAGGNPTVDLTNGTLTLGIPCGADAVNPFKGYFDSLSDLQAKYPTGETGDFANVYDSTADKTYRYVWDASLSTPAWTQALDSSSNPIEVTPSTATFATGEELINVGIVKDESSETSNGVWGSSLNKDLHDTILGEIIKLSPTNSESKAMLKKDGTTIEGAYNVLRVYEFTITGGRKYRIKGRVGVTSGTCLYVFYNSLGNVINFGYESTGTATPYDVEVYSPSNATTIKVNGNVSPTSPFEPSVYYRTDDVCLQKEVDSINVIMPKDYEYGVKIGSDGTTSTALTYGSVVNSYDVEPNMQYVVCGASPSKSSGNLAIAFFNSSNVFLGGCISGKDSNTVFKDYIAMTPPNASVMKVYGRSNADVLVRPLITNAEDSFRNAATCCPQITQNSLPRKNITEPLKILLFGSSWHLNVWYYLNKIIASAGIDAEIHGYYIGHSMFDEWVQLYNNDLTPFNGDEETRQATRCVSTNGSDWSIKTYRTNYTKQQYRDDFYNDITSGDWTIIGFQQGARQAPYWQYWNNYSDIVSVIKRNCSFDTQIAFTATWTPAVSSSDMAPDPNTVAGQQNWQIKNNNNTKRFILQTGINKVAPCGSLMWAMRRSQTLNLSGDLASDGLHPDNGLPMYALAALWYDTYVAPIYGISISNVNWLPDTSTQKAPFTNYYQAINLTQRSEIINLIHLAQSDRFGFRS